MQITTTARHCELDSSLKTYARTRLERLERYARDIHEAHLVVTLEKYRFLVEITLRVNHHELVSREESNDARTAIDQTVDRVESQLRKLKERRIDWQQGGAPGEARAAMNGTTPAGEPLGATPAVPADEEGLSTEGATE
jgi:ribosome hibernation promoting factor